MNFGWGGGAPFLVRLARTADNLSMVHINWRWSGAFLGLGMLISPAWAEPPLERLPWNRDLMIAPLKSLETFEVGEAKKFVERAGVPCVIRDTKIPGRLVSVFQWFPMDEGKREAFDQVAIRISTDDGKTWGETARVGVTGLDLKRFQRPMDPTILQLPDGRFRLYFTSTERRDGAGGAPQMQFQQQGMMQQQQQGMMQQQQQGMGPVQAVGMRPGPGNKPDLGIFSAISSDLKTFTFEPGRRSDRSDEGVVDPAVVQHGSGFWMIAHPEVRGRTPFDLRQGYFAKSSDGSKFERRMNLGAAVEADFIGNLFSHQGRLHFFGGGQKGMWTMHSKDGDEWSRPVVSKTQGGDPSVYADGAGKLWVVYVGGMRSDAVGRPSWFKGPQPQPGSPVGPMVQGGRPPSQGERAPPREGGGQD
jgi:hypothetical protein